MRGAKLKINYYVLMLFFLLGCSEGHADIEEYQSAYESKISDCDKLELNRHQFTRHFSAS